ncbi:hypothetical protein BCV70DRAFT_84920 [Testicularia cyperi]|uniref:Uncharacterized protein n=1 Tax=Testicularia cyperi TaxID=1882483 RepID=A0A317XS51_9BASI|nr:hypothetical protein BCV70DRAFT_84920 [Testicularia cyperi]
MMASSPVECCTLLGVSLPLLAPSLQLPSLALIRYPTLPVPDPCAPEITQPPPPTARASTSMSRCLCPCSLQSPPYRVLLDAVWRLSRLTSSEPVPLCLCSPVCRLEPALSLSLAIPPAESIYKTLDFSWPCRAPSRTSTFTNLPFSIPGAPPSALFLHHQPPLDINSARLPLPVNVSPRLLFLLSVSIGVDDVIAPLSRSTELCAQLCLFACVFLRPTYIPPCLCLTAVC